MTPLVIGSDEPTYRYFRDGVQITEETYTTQTPTVESRGGDSEVPEIIDVYGEEGADGETVYMVDVYTFSTEELHDASQMAQKAGIWRFKQQEAAAYEIVGDLADDAVLTDAQRAGLDDIEDDVQFGPIRFGNAWDNINATGDYALLTTRWSYGNMNNRISVISFIGDVGVVGMYTRNWWSRRIGTLIVSIVRPIRFEGDFERYNNRINSSFFFI